MIKLIVESYKDLWNRSKLEFVLNVSLIVISTIAIIVSILK